MAVSVIGMSVKFRIIQNKMRRARIIGECDKQQQ